MSTIIVTHCVFCDKEAIVSFREATDFVCTDCQEFFKKEMYEPVKVMEQWLDESI